MNAPREAMKIAPIDSFNVQKVRWVKHWNEHLFSFAVDRPASLRFRSGEFIMLGLPGERRPLLRAYSIASPSYADELEFLSIKVNDGPMTSRLQQIVEGDELYCARKPTGTLVADALTPGKRLFMLATGTGLAPFLSVLRDPDIYDRFELVVLVHSVRRVSDLAFRDVMESRFADDPLTGDRADKQFRYIPTVTREPFGRSERITTMMESGSLFADLDGPACLRPQEDRMMICGSMEMIRDCSEILNSLGFVEGSNSRPADFVIEKAFAG